LLVACGGEAGRQVVLYRHVPDLLKVEFSVGQELPTPTVYHADSTLFDWGGDGDQGAVLSTSCGLVYYLENLYRAWLSAG
jgi:hypothetical protein